MPYVNQTSKPKCHIIYRLIYGWSPSPESLKTYEDINITENEELWLVPFALRGLTRNALRHAHVTSGFADHAILVKRLSAVWMQLVLGHCLKTDRFHLAQDTSMWHSKELAKIIWYTLKFEFESPTGCTSNYV